MTPHHENSPERAPTDADEALAIARMHFSPRWPDGTPAPLDVREFDLGFLVTARRPPRQESTEGPSRPQSNPGGTCIVVSKETGEVSTLPYRPAAAAMALYRSIRGGAEGE